MTHCETFRWRWKPKAVDWRIVGENIGLAKAGLTSLIDPGGYQSVVILPLVPAAFVDHLPKTIARLAFLVR